MLLGLLAGMWEFPSLLLDGGKNSQMKQKGALCAEMGRLLGIHLNKENLQYVGEVCAGGTGPKQGGGASFSCW